ncbi:glutamic acid-rich protein-like isoform X2 [Acropora millepora]|uniref:glutamic acid-rich protein-like isoform X2 n=1 Tax=Acropora millepora TaxID=45264 RepID=UPI001CF248B7|nr:glutamic acid-rich protein-like isoform X2 [Acropora millepora]
MAVRNKMKNFSKILLLLFVVSVTRGKPVLDTVNWDEEARNSDETWRDDVEDWDGRDEQREEEDWEERQLDEGESEWENESSDETEQEWEDGENEWEDGSGNDDTEQDWDEADDNWEDDKKSWDEDKQVGEWNDEPLTEEEATFERLEDDIQTFKRGEEGGCS